MASSSSLMGNVESGFLFSLVASKFRVASASHLHLHARLPPKNLKEKKRKVPKLGTTQAKTHSKATVYVDFQPRMVHGAWCMLLYSFSFLHLHSKWRHSALATRHLAMLRRRRFRLTAYFSLTRTWAGQLADLVMMMSFSSGRTCLVWHLGALRDWWGVGQVNEWCLWRL
jgi:hypothetical protein